MDEIIERIEQELLRLDMSWADFARRLQTTDQRIHNWKKRGVPKQEIGRIALVLGCTTDWLLLGRGEKRPAQIGDTIVELRGSRKNVVDSIRENRIRLAKGKSGQPISPPADEFVAVQRVHLKLSAGVTGYQIESEGENGRPIFYRRDFLEERGWKPEKLIALRVNGESMEPSLYNNDVVVINTADTEPKDGEVFAVNYEGDAVIKRLKRDAGEWWLSSDNPDKRRWPDKVCHEGTILIGHAVYKQSDRI